MQIARFGGPEVLDVVDLPDPTPGPGQQVFAVQPSVSFISPPTRWDHIVTLPFWSVGTFR